MVQKYIPTYGLKTNKRLTGLNGHLITMAFTQTCGTLSYACISFFLDSENLNYGINDTPPLPPLPKNMKFVVLAKLIRLHDRILKKCKTPMIGNDFPPSWSLSTFLLYVSFIKMFWKELNDISKNSMLFRKMHFANKKLSWYISLTPHSLRPDRNSFPGYFFFV